MNQKIIGIIAEYNPFHLGHLYQINEIKKNYPNSTLILITNSSFTQRGDVSIINKWDKAKIALNNQIDLVVELPFFYATQSADIFAKGALEILNHLKIDILAFGSESNDLKKLTTIAKTQIENQEYQEKVKNYLNTGINYPTALSKALNDIIGYTTKEPNDLLGISYIKEILKLNSSIKPILIKRIGSYHGEQEENDIASASLIRKKIQNQKKVTQYLPSNTEKYLHKNLALENYFPYLKYKIITEKDLSIYQTIDEGIENKIKKVIYTTNTWKELVESLKTKRYTYNKINRMLIHILTSFTKEEANNIKIDYIRIIGFNKKGKNYLNKIKKELSIPIITAYQKNFSKNLDLEYRALSIYYLPFSKELTQKEYQKKPIIEVDEINH